MTTTRSTLGERLDVVIERVAVWPLAMAWHDVRHEGYFRLAGLVVSSEGWSAAQGRNAFELGREYERDQGNKLSA